LGPNSLLPSRDIILATRIGSTNFDQTDRSVNRPSSQLYSVYPIKRGTYECLLIVTSQITCFIIEGVLVMHNTLKTLVVTLLMMGLVSCSIDNPVGAPISPPSTGTIKPESQADYQLLQLPKLQSLQKLVAVKSTITAAGGGELAFEHSDGSFYVKIVLKFNPGSLADDKELEMLADDEKLAASFGPEGTQFLIPGELSIEARGLDFSNVPDRRLLASRLRLLYFNETTNRWEVVRAEGFKVDAEKGIVTCEKGYIPHFSRYGFGF
jgi:hypothetical protein